MRVADCCPDQKHFAKGLCRRCYKRAQNHLPHAKASRAKYRKTPKGKLAEMRYVESADPDRKKMRMRSRVSYEKNRAKLLEPTRVRAGNLKKYGITIADYERMLAEQGGVCAICRSKDPGPKGTFHIDHCHTTGRVRGLLCTRCNPGLGYFQDDPELLSSAISYLRRASQLGPANVSFVALDAT